MCIKYFLVLFSKVIKQLIYGPVTAVYPTLNFHFMKEGAMVHFVMPNPLAVADYIKLIDTQERTLSLLNAGSITMTASMFDQSSTDLHFHCVNLR